MTLVEFKKQIRMNRGKLARMDDQMEIVHVSGSGIFIDYMLRTKDIGLDKASDITHKLTKHEQNTLVTYIETRKPKPDVDNIDMKIIRIISDR